MKDSLIAILLKLELRHARGMLAALGLCFLLAVLSLGPDAVNQPQWVMGQWSVSFEGALFPFVAPVTMALGLLLAGLAPYRSTMERSFLQLVVRADEPQYLILSLRWVMYQCVALIFATLMALLMERYLSYISGMSIGQSLWPLLCYGYLLIMPLLISLSFLLNALFLVYEGVPGRRLLTLMQYLGCWNLFMILYQLTDTSIWSAVAWTVSEVDVGTHSPLLLPWGSVVLSAALALALVPLAAQILEEAELA